MRRIVARRSRTFVVGDERSAASPLLLLRRGNREREISGLASSLP
jgi:hypothetical protein|tara:strand:- start:70 stop:204 length:135 start_codon:yes stop_codon:yes gene_type:complete